MLQKRRHALQLQIIKILLYFVIQYNQSNKYLSIYLYQNKTRYLKPFMLLFDLRDSSQQTYKPRIITLLTTSTFFIISLVINMTLYRPLYNVDQEIIPLWQANPVLGSPAFLYFMNLVSKYFNPKYYPKYIFAFYVISYRKFQIAIWMFWFLILQYIINILKLAIHQVRPFWIPGTQILMESWVCQTSYGSPSSHSTLSIIFLEFIVRFFAKSYECCGKAIGIYYVLMFLLTFLIMFSRVILGVHAFNQVLFGLSIGVFLLVIYYILMQKQIVRLFIRISTHFKKTQTILACLISLIVLEALSIILAVVPSYNINVSFNQIKQTEGCSDAHLDSSFNYNGVSQSYILFPAFGILIGLIVMRKPQNLAKKPVYKKISWKFLGNVVLLIVLAAIPVQIFTNDLWKKIETNTIGKAFIDWACNSIGYFLAAFFVLVITPQIGQKLGIEQYQSPRYAMIQMLNITADKGLQLSVVSKDSAGEPIRRETALIVPQQILNML